MIKHFTRGKIWNRFKTKLTKFIVYFILEEISLIIDPLNRVSHYTR